MTTNRSYHHGQEDISHQLAAGKERQVPGRRKRTGMMATVRLYKRKLLTKRKDKAQREETVSCKE